MCKIILPIKQKYSMDILKGNKIFELRRNIPKRKVNEILLYQTAPLSQIVGLVKVLKIHKLLLNDLWNLTKNQNSLSRAEFDKYFIEKNDGYAYEVKVIKRYKTPIKISKYNLTNAPQSFIYVK